jgi:hypothetical protein
MEAAPRQRDPSPGQGEAVGIPPHCGLLDRGPAGIAQTQQPGHLVEALPGGVIAAAGQSPVAPRPVDPHQLGMPAADQQHQKRPLGQGVSQLHRAEVALEVMNPQKWQIVQPGQGAGRHGTHQQRPHQPRRHGGGHGIQPVGAQAALQQHPFDQRGKGLQVPTGRDLWHHPAPAGVLLHLGGDGAGENRPA